MMDTNNTTDSLLRTIALIREKSGLGNKDMLADLPDAIYNKIQYYQNEIKHYWECCDRFEDIIAQLTNERDQARMLACYQYGKRLSGKTDMDDPVSYEAMMSKRFADFKGWDCFITQEEADTFNKEFRANYDTREINDVGRSDQNC